MPFADSAQSQLFYLAEVSWGVTPAAALKEMRFTGESLKYRIDTTRSNEIRSDRQITDLVQIGAGAEGGVNFELSPACIDDLLEGALMAAWATNVLENGVTKKSFTLEKKFGDVTQFVSFTGMMIDTMNLEFASGAIVTGSFGFVGKAGAISGTTVGTGGPTAAPTGEVLNGVGNVIGIEEGGAPFTGKISKLSLALKNNLRGQNAIETLGNVGVGTGRVEVTGSMTVYFETSALYSKFLAATKTSIEFTCQKDATNGYTFLIPAIKYSDANIVAGGPDQDVMLELSFQAIMDTVSSKTIKVTRLA